MSHVLHVTHNSRLIEPDGLLLSNSSGSFFSAQDTLDRKNKDFLDFPSQKYKLGVHLLVNVTDRLIHYVFKYVVCYNCSVTC